MILRMRYVKRGGHYHCRLFTAKARNMTFARCGELVFSEAEWNDVRDALASAVEFVPEEFDVVIDESIPPGTIEARAPNGQVVRIRGLDRTRGPHPLAPHDIGNDPYCQP